MPDAEITVVGTIIGRSVLAAEALASETRRRAVDRLVNIGIRSVTVDHFAALGGLLDDWEPAMAQILADGRIMADLAGRIEIVERLPEIVQDALGGLPAGIPPEPPDSFLGLLGAAGADEPMIRFPVIEKAVTDLVGRNILTRPEFDELTREAKADSFSVAGDIRRDTIETIRDSLARTVARGPSLRQFRAELSEDLQGSFLGPAHLENVFRTNIQSAYHRAHDQLADSPIVREIFPYQEYLPIHDARTRDEHLALERLGLDGTNVYRRDDPMWDLFTPPWGYQCRCGTNLLTIEAAARRGVREAQRWLSSGQAPAQPQWRINAIPFRPDPDFSGGRAA